MPCTRWITLITSLIITALGCGAPHQTSHSPTAPPYAQIKSNAEASVNTETQSAPKNEAPCPRHEAADQVVLSPREDRDAERLALKLSDQLVARQSDYERVHRDLKLIRSKFPRMKRIKTLGRFGASSMTLHMKTEHLDQITAKTYRGLRCLNASFGGRFGYRFHSDHKVGVKFSAIYHPLRLAELYQLHPDVISADARKSLYGGGDDIKLIPDHVNGTYRYEFTHAWGDCFSGCLYYQVWGYDVTKEGQVSRLIQ